MFQEFIYEFGCTKVADDSVQITTCTARVTAAQPVLQWYSFVASTQPVLQQHS